MKKDPFDFKHPFFDPLWIRIATFAICFGWGLFEFSTGATIWGVLFCAGGLFAGYHLFMVPRPERDA